MKKISIRRRITVFDKTPIDISTGHNINLEYWNAKNKRVISGTVNKL